jgi:lysophospholipid hydrolase
MFIMAGVVSAVSWVVRYRILNMYSRLPPEPQRKEPEIDLFPDTHGDGIKSGLSSYLDEFLSAIKIFGYLERPVFHELTRSMQTRKLIAGETINLEEEKGFCIVVDGLVEIFVKSGLHARSNSSAHGDYYDDEDPAPGQQKYQLLTEVRNGAPMSSLFSIMSLFTEDVKLQHTEDPSQVPEGRRHAHHPHGFHKPSETYGPDIPVSMPNTPNLDGFLERPRTPIDAMHRQRSPTDPMSASKIPPMSLDSRPGSRAASRPAQRPRMPRRATSNSAHPDIIARATVDTTIAIIPAGAFRRLIKIYPKATAHIVHVILSRFQRVTLSHAFNYLGLTGEVLQTERNMIKYTVCQLPNILRGEALTRLKEKFSREREQASDGEGSKGIALHNPAANLRRRSSTTLRKEAMLQSMTRRQSSFPSTVASPREQTSAQSPGPGDLLSTIQLARGGHRVSTSDSRNEGHFDYGKHDASPLAQRSYNPFDSRGQSRVPLDPRETMDEDNLFRTSILECMFKSLGLDSGESASREPESTDASPRLVALDSRRGRALFTNNTSNAFGSMGPFDGHMDGETESLTSSGMAVNTPPSAETLAHDLMHEVEIVFFPKGSVLVDQGERAPGLYYVVDGFLDIGTTSSADSHSLVSESRTDNPPTHPGTPETPFEDRFPTLSGTETAREKQDSQKQDQTRRRSVALVKPGCLAGYIGSVSSYRSFIDVVAKTDVYVGFLPRASLERIVDRYPIILLTMAKRLTHILPPLILHIDFALEWVQVNAGQVIFHDADESDAIYIVLNGRLRLVEDKKGGGMAVAAEFGQGESVGELEVLTETARSGTLHAIRDTELVKFPRTLFNSLAQAHPNITIKISKIIASRMRAMLNDPSKYQGKEGTSSAERMSTVNLRTVAILPVTTGVPVVEFGNHLMNALTQVGPPNGATSLNQAAILKHLGKHAFNKMGKLRLSQYLADLEEKYGLVVYVAGKTTFTFRLMITCMMRKPYVQRQSR